MERITSYDRLAPELDAMLKERVAASFAPDRESLEAEIAAGELWMERLPEGLVLLRRSVGPQRLRFLLTEPAALCRLSFDRTTALELPCRKRDEKLPALAEALQKQGWAEALRRIRLTRRPAPFVRDAADSLPAGPGGSALQPGEGPAAPAAMLSLLRSCFSALTGCLPTEAELAADLAEGRVLAPAGGLIRWRGKGRGSEIRHLAVAPAYRGQGLSKALVAGYLALEGEKLCRVWTGADNYTAQHVYKSFGYAEDGWQSLVLLYSRME